MADKGSNRGHDATQSPTQSDTQKRAQNYDRLPLGDADADHRLDGGLHAHAVHEFFAASKADGPALSGFALALARLRQVQSEGGARGQAPRGRAVLWLREQKVARRGGYPYGPGLAALGLNPASLTLLILPDARAVLRAALDAVRDGAPLAVLLDLEGRQPLLDLTASRRFALAAARSKTSLFINRTGAKPAPSAAQTRWQVSAAPSRRLAASAPGVPAYGLELLRQRGGRDGLKLILEWDCDSACFRRRGRSDSAERQAPLSRPVPAALAGGAGDAQRPRAA